MTAVRVLAGLAGAVLVLATWWSQLLTLVVPRGKTSRITAQVYRGTAAAFRMRSRRGNGYEQLDSLLAAQAPLTLVLLLLTWLLLFLVGFALVFFTTGISLTAAFRASGSSIFTLGFALPEHQRQLAITYCAAASGLVVVALLAGYLPTLYSAYNRRETLVTLLTSRAGVPAWGPEVLVRHQNVGIVDSLPALYERWETFAADVVESHTNYPILVFFRSPRPLRSWVIGMLSVLDSAALYLAVAPSRAPSEARLCVRMGFVAFRDIAGTLSIEVPEDPMPDSPMQLPFDDFAAAVEYLRRSGFPVERDAEEAWPHFRGWRVNYEAAAYGLAHLIDAPPALWSGPRRTDLAPLPPRQPRNRRPEDPAGVPPALPLPGSVAEADGTGGAPPPDGTVRARPPRSADELGTDPPQPAGGARTQPPQPAGGARTQPAAPDGTAGAEPAPQAGSPGAEPAPQGGGAGAEPAGQDGAAVPAAAGTDVPPEPAAERAGAEPPAAGRPTT